MKPLGNCVSDSDTSDIINTEQITWFPQKKRYLHDSDVISAKSSFYQWHILQKNGNKFQTQQHIFT